MEAVYYFGTEDFTFIKLITVTAAINFIVTMLTTITTVTIVIFTITTAITAVIVS